MKVEKGSGRDVVGCAVKLCDKICVTAHDSVSTLWSAFLEVGELDMVQATEKALRLLVSHGDYTGAMKVLEGVYALVEIAPSEDFTDCQQYPALAQMFMDGEMEQMVESVKERGVLSPCAGAAHAGRQLSNGVRPPAQAGIGAGGTAHGALHRPGADRR